jgi:hypothetical protein
VSEPSSLRVSDTEREQAAGELREHLVDGRLSQEEFEQRLEEAYAASTRADLEALRADLPLSPATLRAELARRRSKLRRRVLQEASGGLVASAICVAIWLANGASGSFWPIWVIIFTLIPVAGNTWRLYGPEPDLDSVEARLAARNRRRQREHRRGRHGELPR